MQRFYSSSTGGFFSEDIHGVRLIEQLGEMVPNLDCRIPEDAIAIDDASWQSLLAATAEGQQIAVVEGTPVAIDPPQEGEA